MLKIMIAAFAIGLLVRPVANVSLDWSALAVPNSEDARFDESSIPASVRKLMGRTVSLRGYMHPSVPFTTNIQQFILGAEVAGVIGKTKRDVPLHLCVIVEMQGDARAEFSVTSPLLVTGVLSIDVLRDRDGKPVCIYKLNATSAAKTSPRRGHQSIWDYGGC